MTWRDTAENDNHCNPAPDACPVSAKAGPTIASAAVENAAPPRGKRPAPKARHSDTSIKDTDFTRLQSRTTANASSVAIAAISPPASSRQKSTTSVTAQRPERASMDIVASRGLSLAITMEKKTPPTPNMVAQ
jgi:hypothetical protein